MKITFIDNTKELNKEINKQLEDTLLDILLDLKRTASESAPHLTGKLEKSFTYSLQNSGDLISGEVSVSAMDGNVDYAEIMHNTTYNLGKQSRRKPGGKSAYGGGRVKVGSGYLSNVVEQAEAGYIEAFQDAFNQSVAKYNE